MYVLSEYMVYHGYKSNLSDKEINIYYVHTTSFKYGKTDDSE